MADFKIPKGIPVGESTEKRSGFVIPKGDPVNGADSSQSDQVMQKNNEGYQPGTAFNPLARGVSFGFDDEIGGFMGALIGTMLPEKAGGLPDNVTFSEAYQGIREGINSNRESFSERSPKTALGLEMLGGIATGGAGLAKAGAALAPKGAGLAKTFAGGTAIGGAEGALYGAGTSESGERLQGAKGGAIAGAALGGVGSVAIKGVSDKLAERAIAARKIKKGSRDSSLALYKIKPNGKLVSDGAAKQALSQGFSEGVIQQLKTASTVDKQNIKKMVRIAQRGLKDNSYASRNSPSLVIGREVTKKTNFLNKTRIEAAEKLDSVAKNSLKGNKVDYSGPVSKFQQGLADMDIKLKPKKGSLQASVRGSMIEGATDAEAILNRILKRMSDTDVNDAYDVHRLKILIDSQVPFGKSDKGLKGKVKNLVTTLRKDLDTVLDENFPEYNQVNTQYHDTTKALENLQDAYGPKVNMFDRYSGKQIGIQSRKLISNYASGANQLKALEDVDDVVRKYGGKAEGNIMDLVSADAAIKSVLPQNLRNTFQGDLEKALKSGPSMAASIATGGKTTVIEKAASAAGKVFSKEKTPEKAIEALNKILSSKN